MKKTYIQPTTEEVKTELAQIICASKYTLKRYGQWGASESQSEYGNNVWQIEGYTDGAEAIGGFTATDIADDNGSLETRSNDALWE